MTLKCIDHVLYWEYPATVFQAFSSIYVLTYLFKNTMLDAYFMLNGFKYEMVSVGQDNLKYRLSDYLPALETRKELASLINIYSGKFNAIGDNNNAFSKSWIVQLSQDGIDGIKKAMRNYITKIKSTPNQVILCGQR